MSQTKEQIIEHLNGVLTELFDIEPEKLVPEAKLHDDLDIDSIDTIDLLIELKSFVSKEINPQSFIDAVTIDDVANIIHKIQ